MLDDGPLLAPCCLHVLPTLDPEKLSPWLCQLDMPLVVEIFTLSDKSVLYEMAQYCLQRPWHRSAGVPPGHGLSALMRFFSDTLRCFQHHALLYECHSLFMNHMQAGLRCVRLQPAMEILLPPEGAQPSDALVQTASRCGSALSEPLAEQCVAEEVDRDKWVFRDIDEDGDQLLSHQGSTTSSVGSDGEAPSRRLRLGGNAKLAFSVALFLWAAVRLQGRRIEMLQEFPHDHPLLVLTREADFPKLCALGDSFETLKMQCAHAVVAGIRLFYRGAWREAVEALDQTLALPLVDAHDQEVLFQFRADCHFHLGEYEQALDDTTTALAHNPTSFGPLYTRARALEALGQLDSARQCLRQLLRSYPRSKVVQNLHAQLLCTLQPGRSPRLPVKANLSARGEPPADSPRGDYSDTAASPITFSTSGGSSSFSSNSLTFDLAAQPPWPEPPVEDPPYLTSAAESGTQVEYTVCGGKELGRGAFGRVYKAVHATEGWFLAVKEVGAKEVEGCEEYLQAFELMSTMKHHNIIRGLGMRRIPGFYHILLEICSGGSLRSLIADCQGLSPPLVRKYATQVLLGLRYMHSVGLLHRDIKASNILLRDDGTAKVADMGTCMRIPEEGEARCDKVKGTVLWMAPETFRGRYSTASDMWSFGCVLIEMTTAKDPWHEQEFREQLTAMVFIATRPDALPADPPQLSDPLGRHFFHCCIARDPAERASADLLLRHPWLSKTEDVVSNSPSASPDAIQELYQDEDDSARHGFP